MVITRAQGEQILAVRSRCTLADGTRRLRIAGARSVNTVAATCPVPPSSPAWAMQDPSSSLELLSELFGISASGSSPT